MKKWLSSLLTGLFLFTVLPILEAQSSSLVPFPVHLEEGKRWGYLDISTQKWAISPEYLRADSFTSSEKIPIAWVQLPNQGYTLVDSTGKKIIPAMPFDDVSMASEGTARFKIGSQWGYLSTNDGSFLLSPAYLQAREFSGGVAAVEVKAGKWRFINKEGKKTMLRDFSFAYSFEQGRAIAMEEGGFYGVIDRRGEWILPPKFGAIFPFPVQEKNYIVGKVDRSRYHFIPFYEIVNSTGLAINSFKVEESKPFQEIGVPVKQNGKWGYVDSMSNWIIAPQFEDVHAFHSSVAAVKNEGLWGIIYYNPSWMKNFEWIISPTWENEPDMEIFANSGTQTSDSIDDRKSTSAIPDFSDRIIRVDHYFYNIKGSKIPCYSNFMLDGESALKKGNKDLAKENFQKALAEIPDDKAALYGIERSK